MNVKRTIAIILILSIIVVAVFALSGCNITNDGAGRNFRSRYHEKVTLTYKDETGNNVMTFERTYVNVSNISIEQTKSQQRQSQEARGQ